MVSSNACAVRIKADLAAGFKAWRRIATNPHQ
jgi:hypothetical protein